MTYKITPINEQVFFIRWYSSPPVGSEVEKHFLADIESILQKATKKVYFLSDLRNGRLTNILVLRQIGVLAKHPNWGGGASYATDPLSTVFSGIFTRFVSKSKRQDGIWFNPTEAINFIQKLDPPIFEGIDWAPILADDKPNSN